MNICVKRIFSCISFLVVCVCAHLGLPSDAAVVVPSQKEFSSVDENRSLVLFDGASLLNSQKQDNEKLATHYSHYSHSSHSSHSSHYSSRY